MGRSPCCDEVHVKKGPWTPEEDQKLVEYIKLHGHRSWRDLPRNAGLNRCGKSCRLRWTNYLRPDIKRGKFSEDEERLILHLHSVLGNKWSAISTHLPGRTDNEIKNYWNTHLKKMLLREGIDPVTHKPRTDLDVLSSLPTLLAVAAAAVNLGNLANPLDNNALSLRLHADVAQNLARLRILQNFVQAMSMDNLPPQSMDIAMNLLGSASLTRYQLNDLLQLNGSLSTPLGLISPNIIPNIFQSCSSTPQEKMTKVMESHSGISNQVLRSYDVPIVHSSTPSLVSASPEINETGDCMQEQQQDPLICDTNSTPFQGWRDQLNLGELLDDDFSWKDILNEISWSNES